MKILSTGHSYSPTQNRFLLPIFMNIITKSAEILITKYIIAGVHNFFNERNIMIYLKKKYLFAL